MSREFLRRFEGLQIPVDEFRHIEHLQAAFFMLREYPFLEAADRYSKTISTMASQAGAADKFNLTVTLAYLSLLAERMHGNERLSFNEFLERHPALRGNPLQGWYSDARLNSPAARELFLMPDLMPPASHQKRSSKH